MAPAAAGSQVLGAEAVTDEVGVTSKTRLMQGVTGVLSGLWGQSAGCRRCWFSCKQEAKIYCQEVRDTIKVLKSNRDMAFNEIKLTIAIEDPRARERRENLGIEVRQQRLACACPLQAVTCKRMATRAGCR